MSKILRRPMFRGGPVDSRGTGITSGLMDTPTYATGGRVGYKTGGDILKDVNRNFDLFYQDPNMDQLRAFQSLGMGNPFRNKFDLVGRLTRPAENSIFNKMKEAAPIVQEQKQFEEDTDKNQEILENKEFFSGNIDDVTSQIKTTDDDNDTTGNNTSATEISAQDLIKENAELFKEFLSEGNEKKLRDARIQDLSDLGLDIFAKSQQEGATVGSTLGGAAANLVGKDSRVDKAKAQIDKSDQTAVALAINDYIAGKRSKEQVDAMLAKSDLGFAQAIALADYKKKKDTFVDVVGELGRGMSKINAIAGAVQKLFDKIPNSLTEKDIKLENFNLKQQENVGEYFIYPDGRVTTIIASGDGFIEDVVYSPQGIMSGG